VTAEPPTKPNAPRARHIVVVEDHQSLAEAIAARLRSEGFEVSLAFDGPTGVATCNRVQPDAVVLDLNLPGFDGLEVCRQIQRDRRVPVVMLTARDSETDLLVGLAVGADDYITKPFSQRELVARIHALLRRSADIQIESSLTSPIPVSNPSTWTGHSETTEQSAGTLHHFGVTLDPLNRTVEYEQTPVHLTVTEFDLSHWFLRHPKVVFTREQLLRSVWGYADGSGERTVDSHVQAVRKKLGADFVRTVHGVGYSLGQAPATSAASATDA
jgi:DNA-binding response OmpR family regulator